MPTFKSTMFFTGRKHGWTETWWQSIADENYDAAMANLQALAVVRAPLLGKECKIEALRVSREDEIGESFLQYVDILPETQESAAEHDAAILFTVRDVFNKKKKHAFLRGFWDVAEEKNGAYNRAAGGFNKPMDTFRKRLTRDGKGGIWGWYGVKTKHSKNLAAFNAAGFDGRLTFTTDGNLFNLDQVGKNVSVRLSGFNEKSSMNRVYVVHVTGQDGCYTVDRYASVPWVIGGKLTWVEKDFVQILGADDQRITTRHVGSPLLESRGHARKKLKA